MFSRKRGVAFEPITATIIVYYRLLFITSNNNIDGIGDENKLSLLNNAYRE